MSVEKPRKKSGTEPIDILPPDEIVFGRSPAMKAVRQRAEKTAGMNVPVLLDGQGGTGKEVLARWIHNHSPWFNGHFVKVNCAAIPGSLMESELFGYEKGAFTGAHGSKPGRVELAHCGTLFLDEIADLNLGLQSKLLHFLQDGRFTRIGDESERAVETRLICATNKDLEQEIEAGRFRADLYYRINVVRIRLPRLRERREDIPLLAEYFLDLFEKKFAKKAEPLGHETVQYLQNLDWPGNTRELSNGIARHVLIGAAASIPENVVQKRASWTPPHLNGEDVVSLKTISKEAIRTLERNVILEALRSNQWNRRKAAQVLKISYRALIYKIRDAGFAGKRKAYASRQENQADSSNSAAD
ncbi:MAG TPA: sigma-54 dependent transcriptional regulator [Candidatus Acidoferrum sp.]|nr:sigma-54 dependent transcriptional regulator [Candidatus Acidoferrum sp.]